MANIVANPLYQYSPSWDRKTLSNDDDRSDNGSQLDYRVINDLSIVYSAATFNGHFLSLVSRDKTKNISVTHMGNAELVEAYSANIYFAVVPANQVVNVPKANWPSPVYIASNYVSTTPSRKLVSDLGLVGYMEDATINTYVGNASSPVDLTDLQVSRLDKDDALITQDYMILLQHVWPDGVSGTVVILVDDSELPVGTVASIANSTANPGTHSDITDVGHSLSVGDITIFTGVTGTAAAAFNAVAGVAVTHVVSADVFTVAIVYTDEASGTWVQYPQQYDIFKASGAYIDGRYTFETAGADLYNYGSLSPISSLYPIAALKGRIRSIPYDIDTVDLTSETYPVFRIFPTNPEVIDTVHLTLRGWYFTAVDADGNPTDDVPHRFKALITLEKWNGAAWVTTGKTITVNATSPSQAREISFTGLTAERLYRLNITTAGKGNSVDGDGGDGYAFHVPANMGDDYNTDALMQSAVEGLLTETHLIVSDTGATSLDNPVFILMERISGSDVTYTVSPSSTNSNLFDLEFSVTGTTNLTNLSIANGGNTHDTSGAPGSNPYVYTFTGLNESEIEGAWAFTATYANHVIAFDFVLSSDTIGMLSQTADSLFEVLDNVSDTRIRLLNTNPAVYGTKTVQLTNPLSAFLVGYSTESAQRKEFILPNGSQLSSLAIEVDDFSPFGPGYINYYLSVDGIDHPITPLNKDGEHPMIYHFNSLLTETERNLAYGQGFIDTENTSNYAIVTQLSRPVESVNTTPIVTRIRSREIRTEAG